MIIADPKNREEWLNARKKGIGGSDAACIIGLNKYKSNVRLWDEKAGLQKPEDVSEKPAVIYGKEAEAAVRRLFILDHPEYDVIYLLLWTENLPIRELADKAFLKSKPLLFKIRYSGRIGAMNQCLKATTYRRFTNL